MKTNTKTSHLLPQVATTLEMSDEDRIQSLYRPCWVNYPKAAEILDQLEDLLSHPQTHRPANLLIIGETNNGKTALALRFLKKHPKSALPTADACEYPVLKIDAPPYPEERRLLAAILDAMEAPRRTNERVENLYVQVNEILPRARVKMLIIDEIHNILSGSTAKQRTFLNVLKNLSNKLQIPIVLIGIEIAFNAIQAEPQIANRFPPVQLPRWRHGDELMSLLASYERILPLKKPSNLTDDKLATALLMMSEGLLGELTQLLTLAAKTAILNKDECISLKLLESLKWQAPSMRRPN